MFEITIENHNLKLDCSSGSTVLETGLRNGLSMKHKCSNGSCGKCVARLNTGSVKSIKNHDYRLNSGQLSNNEFLMCCNTPTEDIMIDVELIGDPASIQIQDIATKVKSVRLIDDSIAIVTLRTPRSNTFQFMAGQDMEIEYKGNRYKYPVASCPCNGMDLEIHIRNSELNPFAMAIFENKIENREIININGPHGAFTLNEESKLPIVLICWDNGFAPVRSIVEHAFSIEKANPVHLYWGYPSIEGLPYFDNHARSWWAVMDDYTYTPISCEDGGVDENREVQDIVNNIYEHLTLELIKRSNIYISAPNKMVALLVSRLVKDGVEDNNIVSTNY